MPGDSQEVIQTDGNLRMLVLLALVLAVALGGVGADLLVVLLQRGQILAGLGELALLHALAHVPVHEGALGVHEVELVVEAREHLGHGRAVGDHAHGALHLGQVAAGHHRGRLVVDPDLEPRRAPVHELDGALRLDRPHRRVHVLGHHVPPVHHRARDVLPVPRVALGHHRARLEHAVAQLRHRQLLVVRLLRRYHRRVRRQHEVNPRIRHQVRLKIRHVHVQRPVKSQRRRQRRHHLHTQ
jgi:hypothetical protein